MSDAELTPIVDKNGVRTSRWKKSRAQPSASAAHSAAQLPPSAAQRPRGEEDSFEGVSIDVEPLGQTEPWQYRFSVVLEHVASSRSVELAYAHIGEEAPHAREVLGFLALRARSYLAYHSPTQLAQELDYDEQDAARDYVLGAYMHQQLSDLLGDDYARITRAVLGNTEPFVTSSLRPIAAELRESVQQVSKTSDRARDDRDLEAYAGLRLFIARAHDSLDQEDGAEKLAGYVSDLDRHCTDLLRRGSVYGWEGLKHAQQVRSQLSSLAGERLPTELGRSANEAGLSELSEQARREMSAMRGAEQAALIDFVRDLDALVEKNASADEVMPRTLEGIRQATRLRQGGFSSSTLYGYARKTQSAVLY